MKHPDKESTHLEFKRELPNKDQVIKTIIGFCNHNGGKLIIGVADDNTIVGIPDNEIETMIETVERSVYDACFPLIIPRVSTQRIADKHIVVIEVTEGMNKPYYRRIEGIEKGTYIRLGKQTMRATPDLIKELEWQSRGIDFERMSVYQATLDDLLLENFKKFLGVRLNQGKAGVTDEILKAYNIVNDEHSKRYPTTLGILLFGRQPQIYFSEAMIICSHFEGTSGRKVIATVDCEGTLFDQFNQAYAFIISRLNSSFEIKGLKRDTKLEVPEIAIREALLNMVIHRNYHIKGPNKIAIYDDRIEFFSPGQFPGPLDTNNLLKGITYLRNPGICKILREADYIEKLGSGFIEIFSSYAKQRLIPPVVIEGENYVKCVLPRKPLKHVEEIIDDTQKIERLFLEKNEISISDIISNLSISRSTALRRINGMVKTGKIKKIGQKKSVRYIKVN